MLVDESTAERFWPGESPIGKRLRFGAAWREVVGVVGTIKNERLDAAESMHQIYVPFEQEPELTMIAVLEVASDPGLVAGSARTAVAAVDPSMPVFDVRTMEERILQSMAPQRYSMLVLALFGLSGLIVAATGLYGVIAYSVLQRTREIGVRLALGAPARQVFGMVVGEGLSLAVLGVALGAIGAFRLTRFLESLLYKVSATDPATFLGAAAVLMAVAALASYLPARRAALSDPVETLRHEG